MKKIKFLAAVCCMVAMTFVSCKKDKTDEPKDPTTEQNGGNQNEDETPDPITYTLTVLSSDEAMGTVTDGGTYEEGTEVTITATPTSDGYAFVKWSDENTDNPRTLTVTGNLELTAIFDYAYVDLGLPSGLKWATCNVGADKPEGYGDYFAWGEVESKSPFAIGVRTNGVREVLLLKPSIARIVSMVSWITKLCLTLPTMLPMPIGVASGVCPPKPNGRNCVKNALGLGLPSMAYPVMK